MGTVAARKIERTPLKPCKTPRWLVRPAAIGTVKVTSLGAFVLTNDGWVPRGGMGR